LTKHLSEAEILAILSPDPARRGGSGSSGVRLARRTARRSGPRPRPS
jgi:hypothetical protein